MPSRYTDPTFNERRCSLCGQDVTYSGQYHPCPRVKIGFKNGGHRVWRGRAYVDGELVYECSDHAHRCRDNDTRTFGQSATNCARSAVWEIQRGKRAIAG